MIEFNVLSRIYLECEKLRKQEIDKINLQKRKKEYEKSQTLYIENINRKLKKEKKIKRRETFLEDMFSSRWKDFPINGIFKLYVFVINDKNKFTYVGLAKHEKEKYAVYYKKGYYKNKFIELAKNKEMLVKHGFLVIPFYSLKIIYIFLLKNHLWS